jgi:hypothetical protein
MPAVAGGLSYVWAHRLRGYATADLTSDQQVMDMARMAFDAQEMLAGAAEATPGDSALHAYRMRALMLTGGPDGAFEGICADLAATGEANLLAEMARLNYQCEKWYGSHAEMHAVADAAAANPPNAAFLALKARALIEEWLYEIAMNDVPEEKEAYRARIRTDAFRQELAALDDRFYALLAMPEAPSRAEAQFARNTFGALFTLFPDTARLKPHLEAVGATPTNMPWGYVFGENIPKGISKLRRQCNLPKL